MPTVTPPPPIVLDAGAPIPIYRASPSR
jgi:hypothetical protein